MSITFSGTITVIDGKGNPHNISADDLQIEESSTSDEPMGPEVIYQGQYENGNLSVTVTIHEYPDGAENHRNIKVDNGRLQKDALISSF